MQHGVYWQCMECRNAQTPIHNSYVDISECEFEHVHGKKYNSMNSKEAWCIPADKRKKAIIDIEEEEQEADESEESNDTDDAEYVPAHSVTKRRKTKKKRTDNELDTSDSDSDGEEKRDDTTSDRERAPRTKRKRKSDQTNEIHSQNKMCKADDRNWQSDTLPLLIKETTEISTFIRCKLNGKVINTIGDGHCMFRAVAKWAKIQPGELMKLLHKDIDKHTEIENILAYPIPELQTECQVRYEKFKNVKHNKIWLIDSAEWGGEADLKIIATYYKVDIVLLNTITNVNYTIPFDEQEDRQQQNDIESLDKLIQSERGRSAIYLLYQDNYHYNLIKTNLPQTTASEQTVQHFSGAITAEAKEKFKKHFAACKFVKDTGGKLAYSSKTTRVEDRNKKNINQETEINEGDIADIDKNVESEQQHKAKTRDETEVKKTKRRKKD